MPSVPFETNKQVIDRLTRRALDYTRPFRAIDIIDSPSDRVIANQLLDNWRFRGEVKRNADGTFEWINE